MNSDLDLSVSSESEEAVLLVDPTSTTVREIRPLVGSAIAYSTTSAGPKQRRIVSSQRKTADSVTPNEEYYYPNDGSETYNYWTALAYCLNIAAAGGFLGLPLAYQQSGLALGMVCALLFTVVNWAVMVFVVNLMRRAEAFTTLALARNPQLEREQLIEGTVDLVDIIGSIDTATFESECKLEVCDYGLYDLCGFFGGRSTRLLYTATIGIANFCVLWSYFVLFGESLTSSMGSPLASASDCEFGKLNGECYKSFAFYVVLFWLCTCVIVVREYSEQFSLVMAGFTARVALILIMNAFSVYYCSNGLPKTLIDENDEYEENEDNSASVNYWKWQRVFSLIAVLAFLNCLQFAIPDILQPMRSKKHAHSLATAASLLPAIIYTVGVFAVVLAFGKFTLAPSTELWAPYTSTSQTPGTSWFVRVCAWFVVVFPAIDVVSVFPLVCISAANTLTDDLYKSLPNAWDIDKHTVNVILRLVFCTMAAVLALIESDFEVALQITGMFFLFALWVLPAVLEYRSLATVSVVCHDLAHICELRDYTVFSHTHVIASVIFLSFVAIVGIAVDLVIFPQ